MIRDSCRLSLSHAATSKSGISLLGAFLVVLQLLMDIMLTPFIFRSDAYFPFFWVGGLSNYSTFSTTSESIQWATTSATATEVPFKKNFIMMIDCSCDQSDRTAGGTPGVDFASPPVDSAVPEAHLADFSSTGARFHNPGHRFSAPVVRFTNSEAQ